MRARSLVRSRMIAPLLLVVSGAYGCASDGTGPGPDDGPDAIALTTPIPLAAPVATSVTVSVRVTDAAGSGVAGVPVTFAVTAGSGSVVSPATTAADGTASADWTLGTTAGVNRLSVTVTGLSPVQFETTGRAGAAALLEVVAGGDQTGEAMWPLPGVLSVRVSDVHGNSIPDVPITFFVTSGGGAIAGGYTTTNAVGVATSGAWTLGAGVAPQTVTAFAASAPEVTIGASVGVCPVVDTIALGFFVDGTLAIGDCALSGRRTDRYQVSTGASAIALEIWSPAFTPWISVASASGAPIASTHADPVTPIILITAAGTRSVTVRSSGLAQTGSYTLTVTETVPSIAVCKTVFIEHGATASQTLATTDCGLELGGSHPHYVDRARVFMEVGAELHVEMSATAFQPFVNIYSSAGLPLKGCTEAVAVSCRYTVPETGYYTLWLTSVDDLQVGEYTLTVH